MEMEDEVKIMRKTLLDIKGIDKKSLAF